MAVSITRPSPAIARRGLTLIELLISISIMALIISGLSGLALAVRQGWDYNEGHGHATQCGRVALERIARAVATATATDVDHGFVVVYSQTGSTRFPDTLVVWRPGWPDNDDALPANADGTARISECVIFCPDPDQPNRLLEITAPTDHRTIPINDGLNSNGWRTALDAVKLAESSQRIVLVDVLRTAAGTVELGGVTRAAVTFASLMRPTAAEWAGYQNDTLQWNELSWPLGENDPSPQAIYGVDSGLRQVWLRTEIQLVVGTPAETTDPPFAPFFGSAALYYQLPR